MKGGIGKYRFYLYAGEILILFNSIQFYLSESVLFYMKINFSLHLSLSYFIRDTILLSECIKI